ncbi:PR-1-like protein [Lepidopterella palustris CBS 459.81]|uniref:PR-1-like protein n=1 Tax=Lepidopterella palustris CBS 459.81 TaxID=1314670 RepID=A0A8E2JAV4_9PEZI|nr:PR-1-like protein [Lepidopterella palustris CBS 459.81]
MVLNPHITDTKQITDGKVLNVPVLTFPLQPEPSVIVLNQEEQDALNLHNSARTRISTTTGHPRSPLAWSPTLASAAQAHATHLIRTRTFAHSGTPNMGENLAKFVPGNTGSLAEAVRLWCQEEKYYIGEKIGKGKGYEHWTQVIWPGTTEVGMGVARGSESCVVVARYSGPGNIVGRSAWTER